MSEKRLYEIEAKGHVWERDDNGHLEIFAYTAGVYHNGPRCIHCGYGFCHHCEEVPDHHCSSESA